MVVKGVGMKEKPMIFSDTIGAIKNTKPGVWPAEPIDPSKPFKWMTRRVVKPQPDDKGDRLIVEYGKLKRIWQGFRMIWDAETLGKPPHQIGNRFWVRETWLKADDGFHYRVDATPESERLRRDYGYKWYSPIFMPREASRIVLEVKNVRIERLQDITEDDARAEGVTRTDYRILDDKTAFALLWDRINKKHGYHWDKNPWVYVITFERVK
jgi:hypothetical protein